MIIGLKRRLLVTATGVKTFCLKHHPFMGAVF
jgi:hypothetical protein